MLADLPDLTDPREVPDERREELLTKGHTLIRGVLSPDEIKAWAPVIREVGLGLTPENRRSDDQDELLADAFLQLQNLWRADERMRRFSLAARFGQIAADLLGVDAVRMYHDQAIFKEPGGGPTPFHQDQYYFPLDGDEIITMWMPLVPVTARRWAASSTATARHLLGHLGEFEASAESERAFRELIERQGHAARNLRRRWPRATRRSTRRGRCTAHPKTPRPRCAKSMTIIWFADGLRGIEPQHEWHHKDYEKWMPGLRPGELAAGRTQPVVWRRTAAA